MSFNELSDNVNAVPSHSDGRQELEHIGTMASRVNTFPQLWVWALQIGECLGWNHRTSGVSNITQHLDKRPFVAFARFCWYFLLKTCFTERFLMCPCLDQNVSMLELGRSWACHSDERGRVRGTRLVLSSSLGCRGGHMDVFGGRSQRNQRSQRSEGRWRERAAPKQGRQDHSVSRVLHIERIFGNSVGWFKILPEFKDPSFGSVTSPMFTWHVRIVAVSYTLRRLQSESCEAFTSAPGPIIIRWGQNWVRHQPRADAFSNM